jgi:hypothetical protein
MFLHIVSKREPRPLVATVDRDRASRRRQLGPPRGSP